jgi:mxaA protein
MRLLALALLLAVGVAAEPLRADVRALTVIDPRDLGYFIGDTIRRQIEISVDEKFRLTPGTAPAPGALTYWLELNDVWVEEDVSGGLRTYSIVLDYQTFYAPLEPRRMTLPPIDLRFADGDGGTAFRRVPGFSFLTSPLREIIPPKEGEGAQAPLLLAPDPPVRLPSKLPVQAALGLALAAALLALGAIAWRMAWWPFHARPKRPFSRAARAIAARDDDAAYRADLIRLHRAFDEAAGHRVLADDAPDFLQAHPQYADAGDDVTTFFAASRRAFFAADAAGARGDLPPQRLARLAARLGAAERRAA